MADYWYNFGQKSEQKNLQISSIFTSNQGLFSWVCHIVPYPVISFSHQEVQWFYCKNGFITETIIFGNVCIQLWHQYQPIVWSSHTVKYWDLGFKDEDRIEVSSEITPMLIFLFCKSAPVVWNDKVDTNERSNIRASSQGATSQTNIGLHSEEAKIALLQQLFLFVPTKSSDFPYLVCPICPQ